MASIVHHRNSNDLSRWDPFTELNQLTNQLERYLESGQFLPVEVEGFIPLADIEEAENAYIVEVELPGVKRDDISVEISGRRVVVSGERKQRERKGILRRHSRPVGGFRYEVGLPGDVASEGVEASMNDGVLTLTIPKIKSELPKRISVK